MADVHTIIDLNRRETQPEISQVSYVLCTAHLLLEALISGLRVTPSVFLCLVRMVGGRGTRNGPESCECQKNGPDSDIAQAVCRRACMRASEGGHVWVQWGYQGQLHPLCLTRTSD